MPIIIYFLIFLLSSPAFALPVLFSQSRDVGAQISLQNVVKVDEPVLQLKIGNGAIQFQKSSVFRILSNAPASIEVISGDVQIFMDDKTPLSIKYDEQIITPDKNSSFQFHAGDELSGRVYGGVLKISHQTNVRQFLGGEQFSLKGSTTSAALDSVGAIAPAAGEEQSSDNNGGNNNIIVSSDSSSNVIQNQIAGDRAILDVQENILADIGNGPGGDLGGDAGSDDEIIEEPDVFPEIGAPLRGVLFAGSINYLPENPNLSRKDVEFDANGMPKRITEVTTETWFWNNYIERVTANIAEANGDSNWQIGRITDGTVDVFNSFIPIKKQPLKTRTLTRNQGLHYALGEVPSNIPTSGTATYNLQSATHPTYVDGSTAPGNLSGNVTVNFGFIPTIGVDLIATMPNGVWNLFKDVNDVSSGQISTIGSNYGGFFIAPTVTGDLCTNGKNCVGSINGSLIGDGATGAALTFDASSGITDANGLYTPDQLLSGAGYFAKAQ